MATSTNRMLIALVATALAASTLSACGGGGGGPATGEPMPSDGTGKTMPDDSNGTMPEDVDLSNVTLGFMAGADTLEIN